MNMASTDGETETSVSTSTLSRTSTGAETNSAPDCGLKKTATQLVTHSQGTQKQMDQLLSHGQQIEERFEKMADFMLKYFRIQENQQRDFQQLFHRIHELEQHVEFLSQSEPPSPVGHEQQSLPPEEQTGQPLRSERRVRFDLPDDHSDPDDIQMTSKRHSDSAHVF